MLDPFTIEIRSQFARLFNSAPIIAVTIDREIVEAVILKPGQEVLIKFEKPIDN